MLYSYLSSYAYFKKVCKILDPSLPYRPGLFLSFLWLTVWVKEKQIVTLFLLSGAMECDKIWTFSVSSLVAWSSGIKILKFSIFCALLPLGQRRKLITGLLTQILRGFWIFWIRLYMAVARRFSKWNTTIRCSQRQVCLQKPGVVASYFGLSMCEIFISKSSNPKICQKLKEETKNNLHCP